MSAFWRVRRSVWRALYRHRWILLGCLALLCFAFGLWGFTVFYGAVPATKTTAAVGPLDLLDRIYVTLALFRDTTVIYGNVKPPFPWPLQVARFVAPLTLVLAGLSAVVALFSEQGNRLRIRVFFRRHLVVCGAGQFGLRLAVAEHERGHPVVVVDRAPDSVALSRCRDRLIPVLVADATDPEVLRQAGVAKARRLVAVCGDNSVNAEIGLVAKKHFAGRRQRLDCFIQVDDDELCRMLEQSTLALHGRSDPEGTDRSNVGISYVNVLRCGPAALLRCFPASFEERGGHAPHVMVVGTDRIGLLLVAGAVRQWWFDHRADGLQLQLTLMGPDTQSHAESLRRQYPRFDETCRLVTHPFDVADAGSPSPPSLGRGDGSQVRTVFVTYADERASLAATMRLAKEFPDDVQVVAVTTRQAGTATLLDTMDADLALPRVRTFHLLDSVCQPEVFMNNLTEQIAQALHENFLEDRRRDGTFDPGKPAHRPWDELAETYRESNRDQAVHYHERLARAGYRVEPTDEWDVMGPAFTEEEIEDMAATEHRRWSAERVAAGWVYDPVHDEDRKRHPDLKAWSELSEASRDKDREIVRELAQVLARCGLAIVRAPRPASAREPQGTPAPGTPAPGTPAPSTPAPR